MKGLHPKRRGEVGLEDEGTHDVICGAEESFGLAILRGGVWARETVGDAMRREEGTEGGVNELTTVIALEGLHDNVVLGAYMSKETLESNGRVRFAP